MKKSLFAIVLSLSVPISAVGGSWLTRSNQEQLLLAQESIKPINHVVLLDLKEATSTKDKIKIVKAGKALLSKIPGVLEVQLGNKAREERKVHIKNYDLALYVKFESSADLDVYGPHENHREFIKIIRPMLEEDGIKVIDFYGG